TNGIVEDAFGIKFRGESSPQLIRNATTCCVERGSLLSCLEFSVLVDRPVPLFPERARLFKKFVEVASMRKIGSILLVFCACVLAIAQPHDARPPSAKKPTTLMTGLGNLHHPVSTDNPQAQQFFDQGLRLIFAFNHDAAARSFERAAELDPKLAMAYWGVAEAVGPNYNDPASEDRFKQAHAAIQKAVDVSANASE